MNQEVYFENIREKIIETLKHAKSEVKIAVAWFTDIEIISILTSLANKGVDIHIVIYNDHINKKDAFKNLYYANGKIFLSKKLMHNKFCILDKHTVINGSYNWTLNAATNEENIQITHNNRLFAEKFNHQYENIVKSCETIEDYFEYSQSSIKNIIKEVNHHFKRRRNYKLPYIVNFTEPKTSTINKSNYNKNYKKYFLINTDEEEREMFWLTYFLSSDYNINKLYKLLNKKIKYPSTYYDSIFGLSINEEGIGILIKDKYLVEKYHSYKGHYTIFFINNKGEKISEEIYCSNKLPNGYYLRNFWNAERQLVDPNLKRYKWKPYIYKIHHDIGIFCDQVLYDFYGKPIIQAEYDRFNIIEKNNTVEFFQYPSFEINLQNDLISELRYRYIDKTKYPYKKIIRYNYKTKQITKISEIIPLSTPNNNCKYVFKSDEIEYKEVLEKKEAQRHLEQIREKKIREEKEKNKNCYIATLVYGDVNHPKVEQYRKFRDSKLSKSSLGRLFIKVYYSTSPNIVNFLKPYKIINNLIRHTLDLLLKLIK